MIRETHTVTNQLKPLHPFNPLDIDLSLQDALAREKGAWGINQCREFAVLAGSEEALEHAERAARNQPRLHTHDRFGSK